jgi:hypothetical protein
VALTEQEMTDANEIGVREPERVPLLRVNAVPRPKHPQLRAAAETIHFLTPETRGVTLQYGIFVRWDCWRERPLIAHELVHAAQYERLGGILLFLRQYLLECLTIGYASAPMELEAEIAARGLRALTSAFRAPERSGLNVEAAASSRFTQTKAAVCCCHFRRRRQRPRRCWSVSCFDP